MKVPTITRKTSIIRMIKILLVVTERIPVAIDCGICKMVICQPNSEEVAIMNITVAVFFAETRMISGTSLRRNCL